MIGNSKSFLFCLLRSPKDVYFVHSNSDSFEAKTMFLETLFSILQYPNHQTILKKLYGLLAWPFSIPCPTTLKMSPIYNLLKHYISYLFYKTVFTIYDYLTWPMGQQVSGLRGLWQDGNCFRDLGTSIDTKDFIFKCILSFVLGRCQIVTIMQSKLNLIIAPTLCKHFTLVALS